MPVTVQKLSILEKVDSTNNYAMALVQKGEATNGEAVFAKVQTRGKGRRGKTWESQSSENIVLTINTQMQWLPLQQQFQLSIAVALGCFDFFFKYIKENIKIKWPNDIFINDSKAGGILIENVVKGNLWQWAVIGIGLNINQRNFNEVKAISLKQITGINYNVIELANELHLAVINRINQLESGEFGKQLLEYNENLFCRNRMVRLKKDNIVFETKIERISSSGELITKDVIERKFAFDEVEWIISE
ncbi:MAG TPA: biotin--[acetyl-CoA-carboxylase] ligase [Ginsengibacter sp.]|nr:biotin--[acetyl-CoA-carboxylase] ligase [Ginsengibacter sp.]